MTSDQPSYGKNLETCAACKAVSHLSSLGSLIRLRDERPNFNHIHDEGAAGELKLVAFSSAHRDPQESRNKY